MTSFGSLYICPTPIGNLEDITLRTLRVFKEVDLIACEDTRITRKLLNHYNIKTKLVSYHKFSEKKKSEFLINLLKEGKNLALVSDAGTPLVSDPGFELLKQAYENGIKIIPLPGASAVITAVSASCLKEPYFAFLGFFPRSKKNKENILKQFKNINAVFYESPSRLVNSLKDIFNILGNRKITIARELTKIYEEIKQDKVKNLIEYYQNNPPKGEITLIIHGEAQEHDISDIEIKDKIKLLKHAGFSTKEISKILSLLTSFPKSQIYQTILDINE